MKPRICSKLAPALVLALGLQAPLMAQTAPAPAEEVVKLSPFVVDTTKDSGYIAVDSLAGGRTDTPIKYTPAAMSSLTKAFLTDLGIQDVREALNWTLNVVPTDPLAGTGFGGQAFHAWSFNFRSAGAGQQGGPGPTRNYFAFFEDPDSYNIERVEFTRGPNSILFGLGTIGGTLSTYTKVPRLDKTLFSPAVIVDDNESLRFEVDYNLVVTDNVAVRINALHDNHYGWRNGDEREKRAVDLAVLYKLSPDTSVRVDLEGATREQTLISSNIADKLSGWDGTTASATWGAAPTGSARTTRIANAGAWGDWLNPFWVYIPRLPGRQALMGWANGYASTSTLNDTGAAINYAPSAGWYPAQIKLPWESTWSSTAQVPLRPSREWTYGHGINDITYRDATVLIDHRFDQHFDLQLGYYRFDVDQAAKDYEGTGGAAIDINKQLPDGSANPNYGKAFADFFLSKQTQSRDVSEVRAQLNYKYEGDLFGSRWAQVLGFSASERVTKISARQYLGQVGNGTTTNPADWVQNMIWGRIYLDQPNSLEPPGEVIGGYQIAYMPKADGYWFDFDDKFDLTSYALFSHTRLFDDRLSVLLGVRNDSYDENLRELRRGPGLTDNFIKESDEGTTISAGAVYYFLKWLGVYGNYSENILPPNAGSQPYISGARPGPEEGKGLDYGLRVSTDDGKYYASLGRYDTKSSNRNVENPISLRNVWQRYNEAKGLNRDTGYGALAYSDTTSMEASGYEIDITANPLPNLRLTANYSAPDTKVVDFYPDSRAHVAEFLPTWNAQLAATTNPEHANNLRNAIASVQDQLAQSIEGLPQQGTVDYTASFFADYTFEQEQLKGWSVGFGGYYRGRSYQATANNIRHYGDGFHSYSAVIAYETKIGKTKARFALNVDNLLDYDDPIVTDYHWGYEDSTGHRIRNSYYFLAPRSFRLSARFEF